MLEQLHEPRCRIATIEPQHIISARIAIKGGFQGRKSDGHPGTKVMWHGLQKLDVAIHMYLPYRPGERSAMRDEVPPGYLRPVPDDPS